MLPDQTKFKSKLDPHLQADNPAKMTSTETASSAPKEQAFFAEEASKQILIRIAEDPELCDASFIVEDGADKEEAERTEVVEKEEEKVEEVKDVEMAEEKKDEVKKEEEKKEGTKYDTKKVLSSHGLSLKASMESDKDDKNGSIASNSEKLNGNSEKRDSR